MRHLLRRLGTLMIAAGVAVLLWVVVVWQWQDPFTSLYTRWKQHQLAESYSHRVANFRPPRIPAQASLAAVQREIAREAARYRRSAKDGQAIGRIKVPRLGLNMIVVEGTDSSSLRKGPGRDRHTYMPGQKELVYVAGHRTTYLAPFAHIDSLRRGDRITLEMPYATFRYAVTRHVVVRADDVARLRSPGYELLALQACHPRFFASHRYIAYARVVGVELRGGRTYKLAAAAASAAR